MGILDIPAPPFGAAHTAALIQRLRANNENVTLAILGDSTGNESWEWPYLLAVWLGEQFPAYTVTHRLWNDGGQTYDSPTTIQTGSGSHTLAVYNGSTPGQTTSYSYDTTRFPLQLPVAPQVVIINYGYNEGTGITTAYRPKLYDLTRRIEDRFPGTGIILTAQPPVGAAAAIVNADHMVRGRVVTDLAASEGYGLVNVLQAFLDNPSWEADWINASDHLHPVAAGQLVWFEQVKRLFPTTTNTLRPRTPPPMLHQLFFPASMFDATEGSPVRGLAGASGLTMPSWEFPNSAQAGVRGLVSWPDTWQYVNIYVHWAQIAGSGFTSGNNGVKWGVGYSRPSLTSGTPFQSPPADVASGARNPIVETAALGSATNGGAWLEHTLRGVTNTSITSRPILLQVRRLAPGTSTDTLAASAHLLGVTVERAG